MTTVGFVTTWSILARLEFCKDWSRSESVTNHDRGCKEESADCVRDVMKSTGSHALGMWSMKSFLGVSVAVNHLRNRQQIVELWTSVHAYRAQLIIVLKLNVAHGPEVT
jgi:hypothetical protein